MKTCKMCGVKKPDMDFAFANAIKTIRSSYCDPCRGEYQRMYKERNKEKIKKVKAKYQKENPQVYRKAYKRWLEKNPNYFKEYYKRTKDGKTNE